MNKKKDYYAILGVSPSASSDEIKGVYRRLARQHHPDVSKDPDSSASVLAEINEAYEVLGNVQSRASYDLQRSNAVVTDIHQQVRKVVDEYFDQFLKSQPTTHSVNANDE